jgi:hypothetical protein
VVDVLGSSVEGRVDSFREPASSVMPPDWDLCIDMAPDICNEGIERFEAVSPWEVAGRDELDGTAGNANDEINLDSASSSSSSF